MLIIEDFSVKVSYSGHAPPECDICGQTGHIAKNCDWLGKYMFCKGVGYFQLHCSQRILGLPGLTVAQVLLLVVPRRGRRCGHSR